MVHSGEPKSPSDAMADGANSSTSPVKWCVKCLTYHDPLFNCLCVGEASNQIQTIIDQLTDIKRALREIEYAIRQR